MMITGKVQTFGIVEILSITKGRMSNEFVKSEMNKLFQILKSKPILQHIRF